MRQRSLHAGAARSLLSINIIVLNQLLENQKVIGRLIFLRLATVYYKASPYQACHDTPGRYL
jgi:hypothetical protein